MNRISFLAFFFAFMMTATSFAAVEKAPPPPSTSEKCPVCGMFVAKYPDWTGIITFKDSSRLYFDGPKDLFTYYLTMKKYTPRKSRADIATILVKDYYSLAFVPGEKAYYVIGSDVYGPMGKELVPFGNKGDAEEFLRDHKGKTIMRFGEITPELLKTLE